LNPARRTVPGALRSSCVSRSRHGILETVATPKPPVPLWRWAAWLSVLGAAIVVFYVLLTPVWLGLRALAWLADRTSRTALP